MRGLYGGLLAAGLFGVTGAGAFAQEIAWQQVIDLPPGLNLPAGVALDIIGIAPGQSPEQAMQALVAYAPDDMAAGISEADQARMGTATAMGSRIRPPFVENATIFSFDLPTPITVEYVSEYVLERLFGENNRASEVIRVDFSAPSSGQQVIGVTRRLEYYEQHLQPRISEIIAGLTQKIGVAPVSYGFEYLWQFDDGAQVTTNAGRSPCTDYSYGIREHSTVPYINEDGQCDIFLEVRFAPGISDDHAGTVVFTLSDNERAKANVGADYAFFEEYVTRYQQETGGAAPVL